MPRYDSDWVRANRARYVPSIDLIPFLLVDLTKTVAELTAAVVETRRALLALDTDRSGRPKPRSGDDAPLADIGLKLRFLDALYHNQINTIGEARRALETGQIIVGLGPIGRRAVGEALERYTQR